MKWRVEQLSGHVLTEPTYRQAVWRAECESYIYLVDKIHKTIVCLPDEKRLEILELNFRVVKANRGE